MRLWILVAAALVSATSWAQEAAAPPEPGSVAAIPSTLLDEALVVSIGASLARPDEAPSWQAKDVKYTIPGTSVSIKLFGSDVAVVITMTPYDRREGGILLVAQGQVWYKETGETLRYRTTVETLPVAYGERVFFYPFGTTPESGAPLRVDLVIERYRDKPAAQTATAAASTKASPPASSEAIPLAPAVDGTAP